jgi:hypothetical protein
MNCHVNVATLLSAAKDLTPDPMTYCGLGIRSFPSASLRAGASLRTTKRADAL